MDYTIAGTINWELNKVVLATVRSAQWFTQLDLYQNLMRLLILALWLLVHDDAARPVCVLFYERVVHMVHSFHKAIMSNNITVFTYSAQSHIPFME